MTNDETVFVEAVLSRHIYVARLIEKDGSVTHCVTDAFSIPIASVRAEFWNYALSMFGSFQRHQVSNGGYVDVITLQEWITTND